MAVSDQAQLLAKWAGWLTDDGPISGTVGRLEVDRDRWALLRREVLPRPDVPNAADTLGWFWHHYACDAAVRLRRLGDPSDDSASLGRLLKEVARHAHSLTRSGYLDAWRNVVGEKAWEVVHKPSADRWFDEFAGEGGDHVRADLVEVDAERLRVKLAPVKLYVDKRLAHHNPRKDPSLSYEEISSGIDSVAELHRKYVRLVRRVQLPSTPPADNTRWGEAFQVAWLPLAGE